MADYDLVIRGGTVVDPTQSIHTPMDVAIADGLVAAIEAPGTLSAQEELDATGQIVAPGLVDLHAHIFPAGSRFGIDADTHCLRCGVTTVLDAGTAGALTWDEFETCADAATTRVLAMLNIATIGMPDDGELLDASHADADRAVATVDAHRDRIVGLKVRLSPKTAGHNAEHVLDTSLDASRRAGVPLMVHANASFMPMPDVLDRLRPGDVLTHCFNSSEHSVLDATGAVRPQARAARSRGVLFDVGHGLSSFSFLVAERSLAQGFRPDTISSDLHSLCVDGPAYDLPHVLSKFLLLGMSLDDVLARATSRPAEILAPAAGMGSLRPGAPADVVLLTLNEGDVQFRDGLAVTRTGTCRVAVKTVLRCGRVVGG